MYLVDLDLDGTPELIGGSDSMTHSPVTVAVTVRQGNLTPLAQSGGGLSGDSHYAGFSIGLPAFQHMKLYQHENGTLIYRSKARAKLGELYEKSTHSPVK